MDSSLIYCIDEENCLLSLKSLVSIYTHVSRWSGMQTMTCSLNTKTVTVDDDATYFKGFSSDISIDSLSQRINVLKTIGFIA